MPETRSERLAVLIDADNTSGTHAAALLEELARYGTPTVKRAYGDWTTPRLGGWKDALNRNAIQPVQQFAYTVGKNATDSALIIDAMDLLYTGDLDGFALVSSDSDFTRLATRLRESGKTVYGLGRRRTPESLVKACDKFIYLEVLGRAEATDGDEVPPEAPDADEPPLPDLRRILAAAIENNSGDDGWATLSVVGQYLVKTDASFDSRNYGYAKLSALVRAQRFVELEQREGRQDRIRLRAGSGPGSGRGGAKKTAKKSTKG